MIYCSLHTRTIAGWNCTGCGRVLCPECTGWRPAGHGRVDICMRCGSMARRLRVHRSARDPFRSTLAGALVWPFSAGGLFTLCAVAAVTHLLQLSGGLGGLIGYGVALAYFFQVVRHTAAGHDDVPAPGDFRGFFDDVVGPGMRAILASMWFVSPFIIWYLATGHSLQGMAVDETLKITPLPVAILLAGALLYPMSIIAGALNCPMSTALNPFAIIGLTIKLGRDYWICSFFCLGCALAGGAVAAFDELVFKHVPIPFSGFIGTALSLYFPFVTFRALGLLVRARGDDLGYGGGDSYKVYVIETAPAHELKPAVEKLEDEVSERFYTPIELSPLPSLAKLAIQNPAESAAELGTPIPLLPLEDQRSHPPANASGLPAPPDPRLPSRLAQSIASGDLAAARTVLREGSDAIPAGTLSAKGWSDLSRAFSEDASKLEGDARRSAAELALLSCTRAVEVAPEGALAPRIWLAAARICDELLADRARSDRMLSELAKKFPATPEGQFAAKRLASTLPAPPSTPPASTGPV